ncbi:hypothetical protein RI065_03060 [Mycoplasmatota bacterium zrk1]
MNYRFSKVGRVVIIINIILTLMATVIHGFNIYRIEVTENKISAVMEEYNVLREEAIDILIEDGENLYLGSAFVALTGFTLSILAQFIYYKYAKENEFFSGFFSCIFGLITNYVGGILLFYILFSGKSEGLIERKEFNPKNKWEKFIRNR